MWVEMDMIAFRRSIHKTENKTWKSQFAIWKKAANSTDVQVKQAAFQGRSPTSI